MSKADKLKLSGTTNKRISKKSIPEEKKGEVKEPINLKVGKMKKTNIELTEKVHLKAKITAMEDGISLKEYIGNLILDDLAKRGKI